MWFELLAQLVCLLAFLVRNLVLAILFLPLYVLRNLLLPPNQPSFPNVVFYEGLVTHERLQPKRHKFRCVV